MQQAASPRNSIRVMIVDDSAVIRSIIEKILKTDESIHVCGFAATGDQAVQMVSICNPDIVLLDIEMPVMDGITALPLILEKKPGVSVLMCSTLSERGAQISVRAMSLGAADCILKPSGSSAIQQSGEFHSELLRLVKTIGAEKLRRRSVSPPPTLSFNKPKSNVTPAVLAIGSSTGGPSALSTLLSTLNGLPIPVLITQHMPRTFTKILASHLSQTSGLPCHEAENDMIVQPGNVYIAQGGYHMVFKRTASGVAIVLDDGPMENFCKPSVDPMMRSLISIYGDRILALILTGMGEDGLKGVKDLIVAGGNCIAQDAATSVVWGMPGAVANAGLCSAVLPLHALGNHIQKLCGRSSLFQNYQSGEKV